VNIITKHMRATQTTEAGIVRREAPIHHSKAMLIDPSTGEPTRVRRQKDADGTVERISVKSGVSMPRSR
jgi:large subunit ribosomal protein L24